MGEKVVKILNSGKHYSYYASVGGATRHTVVVLSFSHYASVGGATGHTATVVVLCISLAASPLFANN